MTQHATAIGTESAPADVHAAGSQVCVDCGWGRLVFAQTFADPHAVVDALEAERPEQRDVAFYIQEPHVVTALAPQAVFLDPSHTFRLALQRRDHGSAAPGAIAIRGARAEDQGEINRIYRRHGMVPLREGYCAELTPASPVTVLVAEGAAGGETLEGVVMGVDHRAAFADPDNGSSLWSLAVDPDAGAPGIGAALVSALADLYRARGRAFMDLSVMHDNTEAIALYRKLGFERVRVYCLKRKNPVNEKLFIGPQRATNLNAYGQIIVDEALRRGIAVDIEDAEANLFTLTLGGRSIACRESLSELTSAVAMSRCDDKALTTRLVAAAGLRVPEQIVGPAEDEARALLARHRRVVVKPARGEQGHGVFVDLRGEDAVRRAVAAIEARGERVLVEQFVDGEDLRIIVIDGEVVAAAVRKPAAVCGDGRHAIAELIRKQSRRRAAATGGESAIPLDDETERCVAAAGYAMDDVLPEGETLVVRKTANLHTGGTITDVTPELHPELAEAAVRAARALDIPVVGFDFIVADPSRPDYAFIEANERPGLANHEPQPTAQRFIDLLFPQTRSDARA